MPAAPASTICRMLAGIAGIAVMAADPPSVTTTAVSGLRRSRTAEASRAQMNAGYAHMI
jgi:hypothetical protein